MPLPNEDATRPRDLQQSKTRPKPGRCRRHSHNVCNICASYPISDVRDSLSAGARARGLHDQPGQAWQLSSSVILQYPTDPFHTHLVCKTPTRVVPPTTTTLFQAPRLCQIPNTKIVQHQPGPLLRQDHAGTRCGHQGINAQVPANTTLSRRPLRHTSEDDGRVEGHFVCQGLGILDNSKRARADCRRRPWAEESTEPSPHRNGGERYAEIAMQNTFTRSGVDTGTVYTPTPPHLSYSFTHFPPPLLAFLAALFRPII